MTYLQEGDIFELEAGHAVYCELPEHFAYGNREGVFDKLAKTEITVGESKNGMETNWLLGEYVVTSATMTGGGTAMFNDQYPGGHQVKAEKLQDKSFNARAKISFYQSGCFTCMNPGIKATGHAKALWNRDSA